MSGFPTKSRPWGLVKSQDKDSTMVLTKVITDAKDHITGTPKKFDPMQMMRDGQQGQQRVKRSASIDSLIASAFRAPCL